MDNTRPSPSLIIFFPSPPLSISPYNIPPLSLHTVAVSPSHTSPATIEEEDEEEAPPPPIATRPEKTKSIYTKPIEEVEPKMTLTPINESTGSNGLGMPMGAVLCCGLEEKVVRGRGGTWKWANRASKKWIKRG